MCPKARGGRTALHGHRVVPRGVRFRYELEAPIERVVEQETNVAVNVKAVVPLRVIGGHSDADELGA